MALDKLTQITSSGINSITSLNGITADVATFDSVGVLGIATAVTVQVGSATTVHTTGIDLGSGNITSNNINSTGIITATGLDINGNVSIGGTLTYEDVTNIDSVGIITAQSGIHVPGVGNLVGIGTTNPLSRLHVSGTHNSHIRMTNTSDDALDLIGDANRSNANTTILGIKGRWNGTDVTKIVSQTGSDTTDKDDGNIVFHTKSSGSSIAERLRITSDGLFGFNHDSPQFGITIAQSANDIGKLGWEDGSNNKRASITCSTSTDALQFHVGTSDTERLRITSDGKVGIGTDNPTQALEVAGKIIKTEYNPGELIECLDTIANGKECTLSSGSYTPTNVTAVQDLSTSFTDINGSVFTYNVPVGTKRLVYDFWVYMRDKDVGPLLHFKGFTTPDGSSSYTSVNTSRATWRAATSGADYQIWIHNRMVLFDHSSEVLGDGLLNSLGGTTRKLKFQCREYSTTYEAKFHQTNSWDGGGTDIIVVPQIRIAAYA